MSTAELLRDQDWGAIQAKLARFAHGRTFKRSWAHAEDLAQTAIADLLARPESWEPEKEPLLKHLAKRVIGLAKNEWSRKRSSLETLSDCIGDDDAPDEADGQDLPDDVLHRRRIATRIRAGLEARVAGDEDASLVLACQANDIDTPQGIARASGLPLPRARAAIRRVAYQARELAKEISEELDEAEDERAGLRERDEEQAGVEETEKEVET